MLMDTVLKVTDTCIEHWTASVCGLQYNPKIISSSINEEMTKRNFDGRKK